jgi:hypothetical protein
MAILKPYLSQDVQPGQRVALKTHELFWRTVGHGSLQTVSDFKLEIHGRVELAVYQGDLQIQLALLDQDEAATAGACRLQINALADDQATYRVRGDGLTISTVLGGEAVDLKVVRAGQDNMTECKVSGPLDLTAYIAPT